MSNVSGERKPLCETNSRELYLEKISSVFRISPFKFAFLVYSVGITGNILLKYSRYRSVFATYISYEFAWMLSSLLLVVFLLRLKAKYVETVGSLNLPMENKVRIVGSFPSKPLRILLFLVWTAYFMFFQIVFYVFILRIPFHVGSQLEFAFWYAFLPFGGLIAGEFFAVLFEVAFLPFRIRNRVSVNALHFDHHGGLGVISGLFTLSIVALSSIMLSYSVAFSLSRTVGGVSERITSFWLWADILGGTLVLVLFFVIPQVILSARMKDEKHRELDAYYQKMAKDETSKDSGHLLARLYDFTVYQETQKMQEYPFSSKDLEIVLGIALIPVLEKIFSYLLIYL